MGSGSTARAHLPTPLTAENLLKKMDAAGVARAVLVPPSWEGDRNDVVLAAAHRYPERFAVMGRISLDAPESRDEFLPLTRTKGMLGLRFTFHTPEQQKLLTSGAADWLWPAAATLFTEELAWLAEDHKAWIMGRGLCEWLNLPMSASEKLSPNVVGA